MTDRNGAGSANGRGSRRGVNPGPDADAGLSDVDLARSELQLWHVYDAGGTEPRLRVRYCDGLEVMAWRHGPDLATALLQAGAQGWHAFDYEPGHAPFEHAIIHLKRTVVR